MSKGHFVYVSLMALHLVCGQINYLSYLFPLYYGKVLSHLLAGPEEAFHN